MTKSGKSRIVATIPRFDPLCLSEYGTCIVNVAKLSASHEVATKRHLWDCARSIHSKSLGNPLLRRKTMHVESRDATQSLNPLGG